MTNTRIKRALIICDMQTDCMPSLFTSASRREAFLDAVQCTLLAATSSPLPIDNSLILFTGLRFPSRYEGLDPEHALYGSLRRLNQKVGDGTAHWFMENYPGSEIDASLIDIVKDRDDVRYQVLWRQGHLPSKELLQQLMNNETTDATVVGAKASQAVQATVQHIAEYCPSIDLSVVEEALADDKQDRLEAVTQHLLPLYARVATIEEYVDATCGSERFAQIYSSKQQQRQNVQYYVNCERGGHYSLYVHHLTHLEGSAWHKYPRQKWYEDVFCGKQYFCPLGKRVVNFCDEPQFSAISMFLKGRDCLDDKGKLIKLAKEYLPESYVIRGGSTETIDSASSLSGPWFVKETNKNGGRAITVCKDATDAVAHASNENETYVIQRHVDNPNLLKDGRKWHLKVYNFLICDEEGTGWTLRCHNEPFLCVADKPWSANDLSPEAQITIRRTKRVKPDVPLEELGRTDNKVLFQKCTEIISSVVHRAIESNELQGRPGKKQFEVFSADFMFDTDGKAHLIEFNFSPVLFDPLAKQELTTKGLKAYMRDYELNGDAAAINDHAMIKDVVSMVFYPKQIFAKKEPSDSIGGWQYVKSLSR